MGLLKEEYKLVESLIDSLDIKYSDEIKNELIDILTKTKDYDIKDMVNVLKTDFNSQMEPIINEKITPTVAYGIKNDFFELTNTINTDINTDYHFDSISKVLVSTIVMMLKLPLSTTINELDSDYACTASIRDILSFTANIKTDKRLDYLDKEETIVILKRCKEVLTNYNYYQYNDIGYMLLRQVIPGFLDVLNNLINELGDLAVIPPKNTIGGKIGEENVTPEYKGRDIIFPGHAGLTGNIRGLLRMYYILTCTDKILTASDLQTLLRQPYDDPRVYNPDGTRQISKNGSFYYMAKIAGFYRMPNNIVDKHFSKMASCDFSELTTTHALASSGTCGSWVVKDKLGDFSYVGGILSNPYGYVDKSMKDMAIPHTNLEVNEKGVIKGYSAKLNPYKEKISKYGILLTLLTQYIDKTDGEALKLIKNQQKL